MREGIPIRLKKSERDFGVNQSAGRGRHLPVQKARFQKGEASWLVLVDDDTWVTIPRLLDVLSKYRHGAKNFKTLRPQMTEITPDNRKWANF